MANLVNLTPHKVVILSEDNTVLKAIEPSGILARCSTCREEVGKIDGIPVNRTSFGVVSGLPGPEAGTYYIVSALTAQAVPNRADVLITDDAVRDQEGKIIGCRALAHI